MKDKYYTSAKREPERFRTPQNYSIEDISESMDIDEVAMENKFFIKQTLENLKRRKKAEKNAKTTTTIKNNEENLSLEIGTEDINIRSHT